MKNFLLLACLISIYFSLPAQTYVPDDNFEQALIDLGYDTGPLDDYVPTANINTITQLDVNSYFISSMEGIEDFTALQDLVCWSNNLTSLDLSSNMSLLTLSCFDNFISNLVLPNNNAITHLNCGGNQLTSIDVSSYPNLYSLACYNNSISSVDVTQNPSLGILSVSGNSLSGLDVSQNPNLVTLYCQNTGISSIDVSQNVLLETFWVYDNPISSLNLSMNTVLEDLACMNTNLSTLNLSNNTSLLRVDCEDNLSLSSISLPTTNTFWRLDSYNTGLTSLDASGLTGLEYLRLNYCNSLSSLILPNTNTLHTLWAYTTNLSSLDLSNNTGLQYLDIANANFTSIDVSMLPNLIEFYCNENDMLSSLDISNGNNIILDWMFANVNPNLGCIQVDNAADANSRDTNMWRKDATADYLETCTLSNDDFDVSGGLNLYPNPVDDGFYIESNYKGSLYLYDMLGKQIVYKTLEIGTNYIDTVSYSDGMYLLKIESENGSSLIKKIIKN